MSSPPPAAPQPALPPLARPVVLVGMMGAGKSAIGRRLAARLELEFVDSDDEIEKAAGMEIAEIFRRFGQDHFREGERKVLSRLLDGSPRVIATGGGAFIDPDTRRLVLANAISIWLRADLEVLHERTTRKKAKNRPLLAHADPRLVLEQLMRARYPVYSEADLAVDTGAASPEETTEKVIRALADHLAGRRARRGGL